MLHKILAICLLLVPTLAQDSSGDWPAWRGPLGNGVSPETGWQAQGAPEDLWRLDVGLGYASPSIVDGKLYVMGYRAELESDVLLALDAETGEQIWSHRYPTKLRNFDHGGGSLTTPSVDGERLYVTNREGGVRCYLAATGEVLWYKNALRLYEVGETYYGYSSSPVIVDDLLVFNIDKVVALDKMSGDTLWVSAELDAQFSTPAPMEYRGEAALAVFSQQALHVLSLDSGEELSSIPWHKSDRLVNASTPIVMGERVFISSAYENGCTLVDFSGAEPAYLWRSRRLRTKMAGCVVVDDFVYGFDESVLMCLSLADGKAQWRKRGLGNGALIAGDGKLVIISSKGELIIAEATPEEFRELSNTRVIDSGGVYWTPPVIAGGRIFCRNDLGILVARDHRAQQAEAAQAMTDSDPGQALPLAAELFEKHLTAIGGAAQVRSHETMTLKGTFEMPVAGFTPVRLEINRALPNLWSMVIAAPNGRPGEITRRFDGELGFELNPFLGNTLFGEHMSREFAETLGLHAEADYAHLYNELQTTGRVAFDERDCYVVRARSQRGSERTFFFEAESGLLAGHEADKERIVIYSDYAPFGGLLVPTVEKSFSVDTGIEETLRITDVSFGALEEGLFDRPTEIDELIGE